MTSPPSGHILERADVPGSLGGWRGVLHGGTGGPRTLTFCSLEEGPAPPDVLDGLAVAFLPTVMRCGGGLHVRGTLTRTALRNLTTLAEVWASWCPDRFHPLTITADRVLDEFPGETGSEALVAWSRSLRSTHTLIRHLDRLVPGAFAIRGVVHVLGLQRDGDPAFTPDMTRAAVRALAAENLRTLLVQTDARSRGLVDPEIGVLPVVAAALHFVSRGCGVGLHARNWDVGAHRRYPQPGPALADFFSGGRFVVRADGGAASPPEMADAVAAHPALATALSDCQRNPGHLPPCGHCFGCTLLALAFAARGRPLPHAGLRITATGIAMLPLHDPAIAAATIATMSDWAGESRPWLPILQARVGLNAAAIDVRDHLRWIGAMLGILPPWPR